MNRGDCERVRGKVGRRDAPASKIHVILDATIALPTNNSNICTFDNLHVVRQEGRQPAHGRPVPNQLIVVILALKN